MQRRPAAAPVTQQHPEPPCSQSPRKHTTQTHTTHTHNTPHSFGAWYSLAAGFTPYFRSAPNAACALWRALSDFAAAHPSGPPLVLDTGLLTDGVITPGGLTPQGFYFRVSSAARGSIYEAERNFDAGRRPMPIRSVSKGITAALVMALVDAGTLALDDAASKYLPAYGAGQLAAITLRMLLGQTAGLSEVRDDPALRNATSLQVRRGGRQAGRAAGALDQA